MQSNIIKRESTGYTVAHVEAYLWDPITPIGISMEDYSGAVTLTVEEAEELIVALRSAIDKVRE